MAHLFIVNEKTFKYHLEYMFAGTGAEEASTDFIFDNKNANNGLTKREITNNEKRSVAMITDLCRIKKGDDIIFFVQGKAKFYGTFKAKTDFFVDPNDDKNYLKDSLGKTLTYRILIEPEEVYEQGLSEFDYLDLLEGINYPDQLCWSLIYRKLGGNRGCTMITDAEFSLFKERLKSIKNNKIIKSQGYTFNSKEEIIAPTTKTLKYTGRKFEIDKYIKNNLFECYKNSTAFEHYLQYQTIKILKSKNYTDILSCNAPVIWIGNEVVCSVGEHRIDALAIQEEKNTINISLIELKYTTTPPEILEQLDKYIYWLKYYIVPSYTRKNKKVVICPIIISANYKANSQQKTKEKINNLENLIKQHSFSKYENQQITIKNTNIIHFKEQNNQIKIKK